MRKTTTSRAIFFSAAATAVLALAACGKKGDPLPPLRLVPAPAEEVSLRQIGDRLRLTWKAPARNEDGSRERVDLEKATILRRVIEVPPPPAAASPEGAVTEQTAPPAEAASVPPETAPEETLPTAPPAEAASVPPEAAPEETPPTAPPGETAPPAQEAPSTSATTEAPPAPPFRSEAMLVQELDSSGLGELRYFEEPVDPAWIGKRVEYAVAYSNRKGRQSALSPVVRVDAVGALPPPGTPALEAQPGFVAVKWTIPPDAPADLAFSVHRRLEEAKVYPDAPLNPEPLSIASFEDRTALFGVESCYVVSAVLGPSGSVSSLPSEEACITPRDVFPPGAPSGLVAVPSDGAVLLSWTEVEADDLKAYRVYRGESPEGPFAFLAEVTQSSYTDTNTSSDETYYYHVTAIDDAPGTNESARSETVEARLGP